MPKRYHLRKLVSKRCYSTEEIAAALNIHVQTVRSWRKKGLQPIDPDSSPFLYLGAEVRSFLSELMNQNKVKLKDNELYCLKCRKGVQPTSITKKDRGVTIGKGKKSILLNGECPECKSKLRKFSSQKEAPPKSKTKTKQSPKKGAPLEGQMSLFD